MEQVLRYLPDAALRASEDVEYVHQLRVWSRRFEAALRLFAPILERKPSRKLAKRAKAIRRAAGTARDADVCLMLLRSALERSPEQRVAPISFMLGYFTAVRLSAQDELSRRAATINDNSLRNLLQSSLSGTNGEGSFVTLLRPRLIEQTAQFDLAVSRPDMDWEALHAVRIQGKRLRYTLEIAGCLDELPLIQTEIYPALEALQEALGDANDARNLRATIQDCRKPLFDDPLDSGVVQLQNRLARSMKRYRMRFDDRRERWLNLRALERLQSALLQSG